jgi:carbon-monoxide dehydrogenase large subunit
MTYSGQSVKRLEDHRLLTGQNAYVDDLKLPGMLHALVLRSPHAHATIRSIDTTAASSLTGVVSVVTALDLAEAVRNVPTRGNTDADDLRPPEHPVLAGDKVCYVGQPVAIVVAEDQYVARDALELIQVDYELLPSVVDPLGALAADAPIVHQALGTNLVLQTVNAGGDLDEAFALADHIVRQRFQVQRIAPAPMEPRGVLADYQSQGDLLTVWDSTQHPHEMREHIAHLLGRSQDSVRVIAPDVGGGFGEKGCMFPEEIAIPYLSILLNRPIRWTEDRQENMVAFHGRGHTVDIEAAAKSDGTLLGIRVQIVADLGAYFLLSTPTVPVLTSHRLTGPYRTPAMSVEVKGVITNKPPTGAYRGAGGPEAAFCMERTVDLIARDLGLDPVEIRRKNFIAPDSFPYETPTGITYDSGNYPEALERALELSDYQSWKERAEQHRKEDTLMGVGLATVVKGSGARVIRLTDHARVIVDPSGRVTAHTGVSPHGQGSVTTFSQLVADSLGVTPWDVQVLHSDTDILPEGGGTSGSRGMIAGGSAMYYVLEEARQKLTSIASHLLHCPAEEVVLRDGQAFDRREPAQAIPFPQVAAAAYDEEMLPPGVEPGLDFKGTHSLPASPYAFGTHVAVVQVSRESGHITVLNYAAVHDAGRIINLMLAEGQVQGGIAQGIGQALMEGMVYSEQGQPLTGSLMDYALPRASNIPHLTLDTIETPSPVTPMGVKGMGELPTLAAPVAVVNAVMDALAPLGIRHIDTPLTPEKVWQAIQESGN